MSNRQQKLIRSLTGHFLGWGDERTPHRYLKLATANGELVIKVAKSLRPQMQDWQPGMAVSLIAQERIDRSTGKHKIKVKKISTLPNLTGSPAERLPTKVDGRSISSSAVEPTTIKVCDGSSCRRRGSEKICQAMQAYLDRYDLADTVQIESVKCLHQCKAAPHAIVTSPAAAIVPGKTHYRQVQPTQTQIILAKHFPTATTPESIGANLIDKLGDYLAQHRVAIATNTQQF
jgi:NADH:ubiquinone oxidoreductase subunit E